ncbi:hypothetical protein [Pseudomonas anguilliseptica]|uniref:hypothetical protein n=1 Tax=Pseudomonas anguilliseptica TaxID=53406 RepID=UPI00325AC444
MITRIALAITAIIALAGTVALSMSADQPSRTIQSCASLLPSGHTFDLKITGTIDTTKPNQMFNGGFDLTVGGTRPGDPAMQAAVKPFVECAKALIK